MIKNLLERPHPPAIAPTTIRASVPELTVSGSCAFGGSCERSRPRIAGVLANLTANCGEIVYEGDCLSAVREAASASRELTAAEQQGVRTRLMELMAANPSQAARIGEVATGAGLSIGSR